MIKSSEGFRAQAYDDLTGKTLLPGERPLGVATIGYGATKINGRPVQAGDTITPEEADRLFAEQVKQYQTWQNYVSRPLTASQKEALTSFEYNLGQGIWSKNAKPILDAINQGKFVEAGNLMKQYVYAQGKPMAGLANRRNKEAQMLLS